MDTALWTDIDHKDLGQLKRQKSAQGIKPGTVTIDPAAKSGHFVGSHGEYDTKLDSCDCVDYAMRNKPCKHMYRLSIELNLFDANENIALYDKMIKLKKKIDTYIKQMDMSELEQTLAFVKSMNK